MDNKNRIIDNNSIFGCTEMKRSPSELALEQLSASSDEGNQIHHKAYQIFQGSDSFHGFLAMENGEQFTFPLKNPEIRKGLSSSSSILPDCSIWSRNLYPNQSDFALPISSQSSICVDSPLSAHYSKGEDNQAVEDSSGSSQDQSDDNDLEIEAGPCEQSKSPTDLKRNKRMVSNRESARRSRRRKQAHLADLERQAEELRGENAALFKQLADTTQQFKDSTTNHRVLRSDVEALRAKVKLAEGMISGGSLTSSLSHLLHNYLNIPQDYINNNMNRVDHIVPPIVAARVDNNFPHNGILESTIGLENADAFNIDVPNGVECVPDLWNWDSHVAPLSK